MTNDTNTLNGALKEAGETLAANLTTQGVPSTWDEGLSTLIGKVLDITPGPTPTPASITLTSDKSILSYADSESATLSATVKDSSSNPIEGVTVEFFKGSTSLGTATTNSSGVATKSYASAGVGDISLTAEVGSLVSETYSIQDCVAYCTSFSDWTGSSPIYSPFNLPVNHEITFKAKSNPNFQIASYHTGDDWNYALNFGYSGARTTYARNSNHQSISFSSSHTLSTSSTYRIVFNNNSVTLYQDNNQTGTSACYNYADTGNLIRIYNNASAIDWLKVKPL